MSSVDRKQTILDCVAGFWHSSQCHQCRGYVDCAWTPRGVPDGESVRWDQLCPDCMILRADEWPDAAAFYTRLRRIRMSLELGEPFPRASVLAALSSPSLPPTLVGYRHPGKRAGFLVESFSIWGYSGLLPSELDSKNLAASPVYTAHAIPVSEEVANVPALLRSIIHVRIGLVVFPEFAPDSWSLYAWIPEDPGSGYRQMMSDIEQLSEKQILDLKRAIDSLTRVLNKGGRSVLESRTIELAEHYITAARLSSPIALAPLGRGPSLPSSWTCPTPRFATISATLVSAHGQTSQRNISRTVRCAEPVTSVAEVSRRFPVYKPSHTAHNLSAGAVTCC